MSTMSETGDFSYSPESNFDDFPTPFNVTTDTDIEAVIREVDRTLPYLDPELRLVWSCFVTHAKKDGFIASTHVENEEHYREMIEFGGSYLADFYGPERPSIEEAEFYKDGLEQLGDEVDTGYGELEIADEGYFEELWANDMKAMLAPAATYFGLKFGVDSRQADSLAGKVSRAAEVQEEPQRRQNIAEFIANIRLTEYVEALRERRMDEKFEAMIQYYKSNAIKNAWIPYIDEILRQPADAITYFMSFQGVAKTNYIPRLLQEHLDAEGEGRSVSFLKLFDLMNLTEGAEVIENFTSHAEAGSFLVLDEIEDWSMDGLRPQIDSAINNGMRVVAISPRLSAAAIEEDSQTMIDAGKNVIATTDAILVDRDIAKSALADQGAGEDVIDFVLSQPALLNPRVFATLVFGYSDVFHKNNVDFDLASLRDTESDKDALYRRMLMEVEPVRKNIDTYLRSIDDFRAFLTQEDDEFGRGINWLAQTCSGDPRLFYELVDSLGIDRDDFKRELKYFLSGADKKFRERRRGLATGRVYGKPTQGHFAAEWS